MKRYKYSGGFRCSHCREFVVINGVMGTAHRNHCNWCLWSKHVDNITGDRRSNCGGGMEPVGLTFKHEGYGRAGEIMLVHLCAACQKISINRIARDDPEHKIQEIFEQSLGLAARTSRRLRNAGICVLTEADRPELIAQLFGR